ncbi:MAG: cell wall hydrolase [Oscillospiraceae bacterium]|nr:cell wall hydrolase [Oscillospiraceae bacterium]
MKKLFLLILAGSLLFLFNTCAYMEPPPPPDYLSLMVDAAAEGDLEAGHLAEYSRNHRIDEEQTGEEKVSFDDLYLLSRLIQTEAGSYWVSDEYRLCVGEVVLNRVASPEYPGSLAAVIYQESAYPEACTAAFQNDCIPSRPCVHAALDLLLGQRMLAPQVVLQSHHQLEDVYAVYYDKVLGFTYFAASPHPELYTAKTHT